MISLLGEGGLILARSFGKQPQQHPTNYSWGYDWILLDSLEIFLGVTKIRKKTVVSLLYFLPPRAQLWPTCGGDGSRADTSAPWSHAQRLWRWHHTLGYWDLARAPWISKEKKCGRIIHTTHLAWFIPPIWLAKLGMVPMTLAYPHYKGSWKIQSYQDETIHSDTSTG